MSVQECRHAYDQALEDLIPILDALDLLARIDELSSFLWPWIEDDPRKPYTNDDVRSNMELTRQFIAKRRMELE